jgi:hypothetical protein
MQLLLGGACNIQLVLFGGWQAACRLDWYKIHLPYGPPVCSKAQTALSYALAHLAVP